MTYSPIFLAANVAYESFGDKLALSGKMLLRGMGTVFLVLIILWGIIAALGMMFSAGNKKPEKKAQAPAPKKTEAAPAPAPTPVPTVPAASASDDALIAVITAAIEAYRAEEGLSSLPYRVVSFKRRSGRKSWTGSSED